MPPRSKTTASKRSPVKRGATGRAAGARGGKPAASGAGTTNLLLGFIAGVLVGGLSVALWFSKQPASEDVATTAPAASTEKPSAASAKANQTPAPAPKPGNEFYDQLPAASVETFSEKKDDAPLALYILQTGAFRTRAEADQMEARIVLEAGMEAWIDERVSSAGTLWYRVRLGPFEGKRKTDGVKRQLWERVRLEAVRYRYQEK